MALHHNAKEGTAMNITTDQMIAEYRAARSAYLAACEQSDRAFARWFNGEVTTQRGAGRLAAKVEQTMGDFSRLRFKAMAADIDTDAIDAADGLRFDSWRGWISIDKQEVGA